MVVKQVMLAACLMVVMLSGCAQDKEKTSATGDSTSAPSARFQDDMNVTRSAGNATVPNATPVAPSLNVTVSALNGTVPWSVLVRINGTTSPGTHPVWQVRLDGNLTANGTRLPGMANLTVLKVGAHVLNITLGDGTRNVTRSIKLEAKVGGPMVLTKADAPKDAKTDYTEVKDITVTLDAIQFKLFAHVVDVPTGESGTAFSPYGFKLTINGGVYQCYNYAGVNTFSTPDSAYIKGCTWDETANTITMVIPVKTMAAKNIVAPYVFKFSSYEGALTNGADDDLVPDSGTLTIG